MKKLVDWYELKWSQNQFLESDFNNLEVRKKENKCKLRANKLVQQSISSRNKKFL